MLTFKRNLKIGSVLFLILMLLGSFFSFEKEIQAQTGQDVKSVSLTRTACELSSDGSKWSWSFNIKTTNIGDGVDLVVSSVDAKPGGAITEKRVTVKNNMASYSTNYVLETNTKYLITVSIFDKMKVMAIYSGNTAKSGDKNCAPEIGQDQTDRTVDIKLQDKQNTKTNTDTLYTLLAPIPDGSETGYINFESSPEKNSCPLGKYINLLIKLFIGISAVLAMIMIAYGGIEYILGAAPSEKGSAKDTIINAIFGLVIALGAYLVLYTLNPNLLNFCLDKQLSSVEVVVGEEEKPTADIFSINETIPSTSVGACTEGITKINTAGGTIVLCNKIANDIKTSIDKAWSQGYKISGWGWRSYERQVELRKENGCPDIYKSPPSKCRVPTAIPGTSMHESGLAIDFLCEGVAIQARDNKCYIWLKENTPLHKLKNLKSEAWHWSTNGN